MSVTRWHGDRPEPDHEGGFVRYDDYKAVVDRLDASIAEAVRVTVELGYDHWLKHGTPIRKQDAQLVALDVQRAIGVEKLNPSTGEKNGN